MSRALVISVVLRLVLGLGVADHPSLHSVFFNGFAIFIHDGPDYEFDKSTFIT